MRQGDHHPVNPSEDIPVIRGDRGHPERIRELPRPVQVLVDEDEPLPHPGVFDECRDVLQSGDGAAPDHRYCRRRGAIPSPVPCVPARRHEAAAPCRVNIN